MTGLLSGLGTISREDLFEAIKRNEGYYPGSRSWRNNNPGNIIAQPGQPSDGTFRVYDTPAEGEAALRHQIDLNISRGLTLQEFFTGKVGVYPGYDKSDPAYASKVGGWLGINPADVLQGVVSPTWGAANGNTGIVPPGPSVPPDRSIHIPYDEWDTIDPISTLEQPTGTDTTLGLSGGLLSNPTVWLVGFGILGFVLVNRD